MRVDHFGPEDQKDAPWLADMFTRGPCVAITQFCTCFADVSYWFSVKRSHQGQMPV